MVDKSGVRSESAWQRIADDIARAIDKGKYAPGSAIPSAVELGEKYDVNRHTVRQAFLHLQSLGLVSVSPGRGTTVVGTRLPYKIGRRVSFRSNVGRAGLTARTRILRAATGEAEPAIARDLGLKPGAVVWSIDTLSTAGRMPISLATHAVDAARFEDFADRLAASEGSVTAALASYGIADYERQATRITARVATPMEADLLDLHDGDPVLCSLGLDAVDGKVIHRADSRFAAARVAFEVEATA